MAHGHPGFFLFLVLKKFVSNTENFVVCIGFFNSYSYAESTVVDFLLYFR